MTILCSVDSNFTASHFSTGVMSFWYYSKKKRIWEAVRQSSSARSQNSQENTCARVSFLIKLRAWVLQLYLNRESGTGFFLWILLNFKEHLFYRTPPVAASVFYNLYLSKYVQWKKKMSISSYHVKRKLYRRFFLAIFFFFFSPPCKYLYQGVINLANNV